MEDRLHSFIFSLFIVNLAISYKKKAATLSSKDYLLTKFAKFKKSTKNICCAHFSEKTCQSLIGTKSLTRWSLRIRKGWLHKWGGGFCRTMGGDWFSPRSTANYNFATTPNHLLHSHTDHKRDLSPTSPPVGKRPISKTFFWHGWHLFLGGFITSSQSSEGAKARKNGWIIELLGLLGLLE